MNKNLSTLKIHLHNADRSQATNHRQSSTTPSTGRLFGLIEKRDRRNLFYQDLYQECKNIHKPKMKKLFIYQSNV